MGRRKFTHTLLLQYMPLFCAQVCISIFYDDIFSAVMKCINTHLNSPHGSACLAILMQHQTDRSVPVPVKLF